MTNGEPLLVSGVLLQLGGKLVVKASAEKIVDPKFPLLRVLHLQSTVTPCLVRGRMLFTARLSTFFSMWFA